MSLAIHHPESSHLLTGPRSSMSKDQDKDSGPSGRNDSAYLKRREQVRKAQRTHRERKDQYFKTLESEVLRLRTNEAEFIKRIQELEADIARLQEVVKLSGHALPGAEVSGGISTRSETEWPSFTSSRTNNLASNVSAPQSTFYSPNSTYESSESRQDYLSLVPEQFHSPSLWTPPSARLPDLSSHQRNRSAETAESLLIRGMEFVLALEKPCLAHIEVDLTKSSEPSGHVLTATMPLLKACQYPHSFTHGGPSLEVSKSIFDRLTLLSPQLVDEDELSPIQLWNYIVDQQIAYRLNNNQLQILAQNLLQHIKCYGFGAVVEKDICMNMVSQMLTAN